MHVRFCAAFPVLLLAAPLSAQNTDNTVPLVIDVHVHSMTESFPGGGPMCPNTYDFLGSDPSTKEAPFGWAPEQCTPKLYPAAKGEYLKDTVAGMKRLNVTAVVFGDAASVHQWMDLPWPRHPRHRI